MAKSKREKLNISFFQKPEEEIRKNITIDEELQSLIPPLAQDEYEQLEQNILTEGCREPITLWHFHDQYILVDGHNRYNICSRHNIKYNVQLREFNSKEQAKDWMITNQLGRRNLTPLQQSYLRGKRYANEKKAWGGKRDQLASGHNAHLSPDVMTSGAATPDSEPLQTAARLAGEYGVNEKTIRRDEQFAQNLERLTKNDNALRWKILSGQIKAGKKTITGLSDMPAKLLKSISKKLNQTGNLEEVIKSLQDDALHGDVPQSAAKDVPALLSEIKKQIITTIERIIKSANDPQQRNKAVAELKRLVNEIEQAFS